MAERHTLIVQWRSGPKTVRRFGADASRAAQAAQLVREQSAPEVLAAFGVSDRVERVVLEHEVTR